jgi:CubicO group peptidase (beta-lactamase class C family)
MVSSPLDLKATLFSPLKAGGETAPGPVAPTEDGLRAGGPLDYPGVPFLGAVSPGVVHDDNARYLGGAAGHAGLFSRAEDLFQIAASFARSSSPAAPKRQKELLAEFLTPRRASDGKSRPLGFDVLALNKGSLFGHAGYTGTAWWWSPHLDRVMILLCNRVHPTSRGIGAAELRRSLVEASFPEFF